jgi:3-deoxy-manno-octulosonate cytidylyltransferase (CMP-KDO synthetase)
MIEHVYRRAAQARGVDAVVVATDDARIAAAVERFGGIVRMTAPAHRTGTDRIAEIARGLACDIVVNVQGDLPLVEPEMIAQVVAPLNADASLPMATICTRLTDPEEYARSSVVKVVVDRKGQALYFSRAPIPYIAHRGPAETGRYAESPEAGRDGGAPDVEPGPGRTLASVSRTFKHIGMYAYRRDFLLVFAALPQTPLEQAESLEQLRALEHGYDIRVVETQYESIEVDTPDDLERVRRLIAHRSALIADAGAQAATRV